ncbi:MAG: TolC family protein [Candidatus Omnitrophica bacterium]|nr:TolC family protein [Candidatus Omnitrophota bacterium]
MRIKTALTYSTLIFLMLAAGPALAGDKAVSSDIVEPQKTLKSDSSEVSRAGNRIILNIPRGAGADGEKFTIGIRPAEFRAEAERIKEKETLSGKEIGVASDAGKGHHGGLYTLKDCIDIAVANHLPLQIAKKSVKLAQMRLFEARRNMLPSATIDYQEYHGRINDLMYIGRKQTLEGQQPIFHGGELLYTMKQSEVNLEITKNDYNRIRNELVLSVKKGYYTLAKAKGNLRMQEELSKEVARIVDMVMREAEAGVNSKLEVLNATSQSGQARYQLASAQGDLEVAELILKQAMNIDTKEYVDVKENLEFKKVEVDYGKAILIAMVNRPEMKINALMIDYYNYGKNISKAKLWPKVDLLGSWGLAKEEFAPQDFDPTPPGGDVDQELAAQWYAGLKVGVPLWGTTSEYSLTKEHWVPVVSTTHGTDATTMEFKFKLLDNLASLSEKQLSEIDFDKARQELTKIRQDITLEVKEGCFNYNKALIQAETAENKVKYQAGDLELVKLKRGLDEAQDSNVIDSMIKLAQEKFGYLQALTDCHISLATVNKAIGLEDYYPDEEVI